MVNDQMLNNKGEVLAKILSVNLIPSRIRQNTPSGSVIFSIDPENKDVEAEIEILVKSKEGIAYFGELNKVRTGENINLFFSNATLWDAFITSVKKS